MEEFANLDFHRHWVTLKVDITDLAYSGVKSIPPEAVIKLMDRIEEIEALNAKIKEILGISNVA